MTQFIKPVSELKLKSFVFRISPILLPIGFGGEHASEYGGPVVHFRGGVDGGEGLTGEAGFPVTVSERLQHQQRTDEVQS